MDTFDDDLKPRYKDQEKGRQKKKDALRFAEEERLVGSGRARTGTKLKGKLQKLHTRKKKKGTAKDESKGEMFVNDVFGITTYYRERSDMSLELEGVDDNRVTHPQMGQGKISLSAARQPGQAKVHRKFTHTSESVGGRSFIQSRQAKSGAAGKHLSQTTATPLSGVYAQSYDLHNTGAKPKPEAIGRVKKRITRSTSDMATNRGKRALEDSVKSSKKNEAIPKLQQYLSNLSESTVSEKEALGKLQSYLHLLVGEEMQQKAPPPGTSKPKGSPLGRTASPKSKRHRNKSPRLKRKIKHDNAQPGARKHKERRNRRYEKARNGQKHPNRSKESRIPPRSPPASKSTTEVPTLHGARSRPSRHSKERRRTSRTQRAARAESALERMTFEARNRVICIQQLLTDGLSGEEASVVQSYIVDVIASHSLQKHKSTLLAEAYGKPKNTTNSQTKGTAEAHKSGFSSVEVSMKTGENNQIASKAVPADLTSASVQSKNQQERGIAATRKKISFEQVKKQEANNTGDNNDDGYEKETGNIRNEKDIKERRGKDTAVKLQLLSPRASVRKILYASSGSRPQSSRLKARDSSEKITSARKPRQASDKHSVHTKRLNYARKKSISDPALPNIARFTSGDSIAIIAADQKPHSRGEQRGSPSSMPETRSPAFSKMIKRTPAADISSSSGGKIAPGSTWVAALSPRVRSNLSHTADVSQINRIHPFSKRKRLRIGSQKAAYQRQRSNSTGSISSTTTTRRTSTAETIIFSLELGDYEEDSYSDTDDDEARKKGASPESYPVEAKGAKARVVLGGARPHSERKESAANGRVESNLAKQRDMYRNKRLSKSVGHVWFSAFSKGRAALYAKVPADHVHRSSASRSGTQAQQEDLAMLIPPRSTKPVLKPKTPKLPARLHNTNAAAWQKRRAKLEENQRRRAEQAAQRKKHQLLAARDGYNKGDTNEMETHAISSPAMARLMKKRAGTHGAKPNRPKLSQPEEYEELSRYSIPQREQLDDSLYSNVQRPPNSSSVTPKEQTATMRRNNRKAAGADRISGTESMETPYATDVPNHQHKDRDSDYEQSDQSSSGSEDYSSDFDREDSEESSYEEDEEDEEDEDDYADDYYAEAEEIRMVRRADPEAARDILADLLTYKDHGIQRKTVRRVTAQIKEAAQRKARLYATRGKGWNSTYQELMDGGLACALAPERVRKISAIAHDFVLAAKTYAQIIINELTLPMELKTIKPTRMGGVAGGTKYIVQGILFKFCLDQLVVNQNRAVYMYGSHRPKDEYAMKVAGHELLGLGCYLAACIPKLHFPLMAVIDYKGFRMVATSLLPLSHASIRYGSDDGGRTVHGGEICTDGNEGTDHFFSSSDSCRSLSSSAGGEGTTTKTLTSGSEERRAADSSCSMEHKGDTELNELMRQAGIRINLKRHRVGVSGTHLYGPGDIEGHQGMDSRYYVLDFGRVMPPEAPPSATAAPGFESVGETTAANYEPRSVFFRMLRPELVNSHSKPLSSDAFSGWGLYDTDKVQSEREVRDATRRIFREEIPLLATRLDAKIEDQLDDAVPAARRYWDNREAYGDFALLRTILDHLKLPQRMHRRGINVRHMGALRQAVSNERIKLIVLSLAMARVVKNKIRKRMRKVVRSKDNSDLKCKRIIASFINTFLSAFVLETVADKKFRALEAARFQKAISRKFPGILGKGETLGKHNMCVKLVFAEYLEHGTINLTRTAQHALFNEPSAFVLGASTQNEANANKQHSDIAFIAARVKQPFLVKLADGLMCQRAASHTSAAMEAERLLNMAESHLREAHQAATYSPFVNVVWGSALCSLAALRKKRRSNPNQVVQVGGAKYMWEEEEEKEAEDKGKQVGGTAAGSVATTRSRRSSCIGDRSTPAKVVLEEWVAMLRRRANSLKETGVGEAADELEELAQETAAKGQLDVEGSQLTEYAQAQVNDIRALQEQFMKGTNIFSS